ncbi:MULTISPECIES: helix-turn-helix domain-containing protein [unclassified Staphylococcus]|uniref:helix-turn-helix domain-containing protein n=1 Tax=unclassified Staphylococcus TaxID=91994 RepID=UPI00122E3CF9|nr:MULTISPECIES: helix-turn-helix domain-containing protein [unclassified Staphylococcus]KAA2278093.1 helix-turn-helix domain-containing protein [Staphylococcus sp. GDX7P312P]KAA2281470.1 helix-turn-helix domain-containing protein [Staphylococcus sp. GDX7P459A]
MAKRRQRITNYKEWLSDEKLNQIKSWKGEGISHEELANRIGINRTTLYSWIQRCPEIEDAIKQGQQRTVQYIENALMKKINGYTLRDTKRYKTTDKDGNIVERIEVTEKEVGPDTSAIIYALKVKDPDRWNEKIRMEHSGRVDSTVNHYANLSEDELKKLAGYD